MPTYEYECPKCSHKFEVFQNMTEDPLGRCPKCGAKPDRLIGGGSGIIFKGSGFYETDYKRKDSSSSGKGKQAPASCPAKTGGDCSSCPAGK